jgi:hypothetical protein
MVWKDFSEVALRTCIGSTPLANSARAAAWRSRASARGTSGYCPSAMSFCFLSCRYLKRQSLPPVWVMKRNNPLPSGSRYALSVGLDLRVSVSVSKIPPPQIPPCEEKSPLRCLADCESIAEKKANGSSSPGRQSNLRWNTTRVQKSENQHEYWG